MGHQARGSHPLRVRTRLRHLFHVLYPSFTLRRNVLRPLALISITFVLSLIAMGFYLVVPVALLPQLAAHPLPTAFWLALFLWSISCTLLSYLLTACAEPGRVPQSWRPVAWLPEPPPPDPRVSPPPTSATAASASASASASAPGASTTPAAPAPATTIPGPAAASGSGGGGGGGGGAAGGAAGADTGTAAGATKRYPAPPAEVYAAGTGMVRQDGRFRFCVHCNVFKPDRAHHCSSCKECVLQMDHHCPFTGNACVGLHNRKFFVLFLYYATLSCSLVAGLTPRALGRAVFADPDEPLTAAAFGNTLVLLMGYVMCALHAFALAPFSAFHTYLVLKNRTTIENQEVRQPLHVDVLKRGDRGCAANWRAVFGPRPWLWFVPVTYGREWDGLRWTPTTGARPAAGDELV